MSNDILQAARSYYGLADTESCTTQLYTNQAGQTCVTFEIPLSNEDFAAIVQRMQNMQQPDTQPDTAIIEGPTVEAMREAYSALSKAEKGRYGSFARYMGWVSDGILEPKLPDPYGAKPEQPLEKIEQLPSGVIGAQEFLRWNRSQPVPLVAIPKEMGVYAKAIEIHNVISKTPEFEGISQSSGNSGELPNKQVLEDIEQLPRQVVHVDTPEEPEPTNMDAVWLPNFECTEAQKQFAVDYHPNSDMYQVQWAMLTDEQKQKAQEVKP